jgi:predicted RND superfamily exporter protein
MTMTTEMTAIIDNLAISLILGILGIAITVFTVVYSFMESTKERKRSLSDRIRNANGTDPVMESDMQFAITRLIDLRSINYVVIGIIILDIVTFCIYAAHMIYKSECWLKITAVSLLGILAVLCFVALVMYLVQYHNRFKGVCG